MDLDYRHRPYPGRLHLIASDELARGAHEVAFGQTFDDHVGRWGELVTGGVEVHRVPGDHFGVMRPPNVSQLGAIVTRLLHHGEDDGPAPIAGASALLSLRPASPDGHARIAIERVGDAVREETSDE